MAMSFIILTKRCFNGAILRRISQISAVMAEQKSAVYSGVELRKKFQKNKMNAGLKRKRREDINAPCLTAIPKSWEIIVVCDGSNSFAKSVVLQSDQRGYMFNCGEGTQRASTSMSEFRTHKVSHIFITHNSWRNTADLLELCLIVKNSQDGMITLHGSGQVDRLLSSIARKFSADSGNNTYIHPADTVFTDNAIEKLEHLYLIDKTKPDDANHHATCYKLKLIIPPRKVDNAKRLKLCLKPGPWLSELQKSEKPIEVSGKTVYPEDVLEPRQTPHIISVVDCPSLNHFDSFKAQLDKLLNYNGEPISLMIHLSPDTILDNTEYKSWLNSIPDTVEHIIVRSDTGCPVIHRPAIQQFHLNMIQPEIFPELPQSIKLPETVEEISTRLQLKENMHIVYPQSKYVLNPIKKKGMDHSACVLDIKRTAREYIEQSEVLDKLLENRQSLTNKNDKRDYPILSVLGSGSSTHSKQRNESGYFIQISETQSVLFDSGNNTYNQLISLYGAEKCEELLKTLNFIFISHGHPDHHIGLFTFINNRLEIYRKLNQEPPELVILAPRRLWNWFNLLNTHYERCFRNVRLIHPHWLCTELKDEVPADLPKHVDSINMKTGERNLNYVQFVTKQDHQDILNRLDLTELKIEQVDHAYGFNCFAIAIKHKSGWKLCYSGDTLPCEAMVRLAKDSDLLLHEATFGELFEHDARLKTHCTVSQTMDIGKRANVKFLLMTHFSARYTILVKDVPESLRTATNIGVTFDNLVCRLRDLPNLSYANLLPPLTLMYPEHVKDMSYTIKQLKSDGYRGDDLVKQYNYNVKNDTTTKVIEEATRRLEEEKSAANDDKPEEKLQLTGKSN